MCDDFKNATKADIFVSSLKMVLILVTLDQGDSDFLSALGCSVLALQLLCIEGYIS